MADPRPRGPAGGPAAPVPADGDQPVDDVPGARLGLPAQGPGSLARLGRRVLALGVDWALCLLISHGLLGGAPFTTLAVFVVENVLLVGTLGATVGHRLLGLRVVRLSRRSGGLLPAVVRSLLLALAIPALVWDQDGRGLHDRLAGTALLRS